MLRRGLALPLALACVLLGACAPAGVPSARTLHYIDKQLVTSPTVDHRAYAAYLRARLALEADPPDLARALQELDVALHYDRDDPHLWTTRGEVELALGDLDGARRSSARALALGPDYPPAQRLAARLDAPAAAPAGPQVAEARRDMN